MTDLDLNIGIYLVMLFINSVIAGLFLYVIPVDRHSNARVSLAYYLLYFFAVAVAYVWYISRAFIDIHVSVFFTNLFVLTAAYAVLFGCYWRYNHQIHLHRHGAILHIPAFAVAQTLLSVYYSDYYIARLLFTYVNAGLVYVYAIYVYNKCSRAHNEPINFINIGIVAIMVSVLVVPVTYYASADIQVFASILLLIQNCLTTVLFGCIFSSFMFDVIQRYKSISVIDDLTGLYNRRSFLEQSTKLLKAAERHQFPISMVLCDIDFFKRINDKYGHLVGDLAIQQCANCLTAGTRDNDIVARFGGEEFVILLPQSDIEGAKVIANRICQRIADIRLKVDHYEIRLTASFGIASMHQQTSLEAALKSADNAMYFAKENGRNQVRSEDEFMQPRAED